MAKPPWTSRGPGFHPSPFNCIFLPKKMLLATFPPPTLIPPHFFGTYMPIRFPSPLCSLQKSVKLGYWAGHFFCDYFYSCSTFLSQSTVQGLINPHNSPERKVILAPLYRWGKRSTESLKRCGKVTQRVPVEPARPPHSQSCV